MAAEILSKEDLEHLRERGLHPQTVASQIERFKKGFPFVRLVRPCTVGDGILAISEERIEELARIHAKAAEQGRCMKFVPASGAATRMFSALQSFLDRHGREGQERAAVQGSPEAQATQGFVSEIRRFAFAEDLRVTLARDGLDMEGLLCRGDCETILRYVLGPSGLNLSSLPKGLIKFHAYPQHSRTALEEQLVEAWAYARDGNSIARIHFTVSPEHESQIRAHLEEILRQDRWAGTRFELSLSIQKPSTDTLAVDMDNKPLRDRDGRLVFRPGGHGALLENLNEISGDIFFIKNIDNVVPDRLKGETIRYKKALCGHLVELQERVFNYLDRLSGKEPAQGLLEEAKAFVEDQLSTVLPSDIDRASTEEKRTLLFHLLNRPLRVCGMVKNEGEPGGGPFWVAQRDGTISLRIVESSQVDMHSPEQKAVWESSTHFNPVDLVCGVRDYLGNPFDLLRFRDPDAGLIALKSKDGKPIKALELPGLWNGAMAFWNTVFVEVPIETFAPVKTILDLLRENHQPGATGVQDSVMFT